MAKGRKRWGVVILVLALATILTEVGISWAASDRASATLMLVAVVTPKVKLQVNRETAQIAATIEDLDRGYVEVPGAAEFLVWTNSKSGLSITARASGDLQGSKRTYDPPLRPLRFREWRGLPSSNLRRSGHLCRIQPGDPQPEAD